MSFEPENDLERTLMRASKEPAARPEFYRLLLESDLFVIGQVEGRAPGEARHAIASGEKVQIMTSKTAKGEPFIPVFSSLSRLRTYIHDENGYLALKGRPLFETVPGAMFILNLGSEYGKELLPQEIAGLLNPVGRTVTMDKPTKVLIGQPAVYPHDLVDALKEAFARRRDVLNAYLIQIAFQDGDQPPHPLIGIETTGDWQDVSQEIGRVVTALPSGLQVDAVRVDRAQPEGIAASLLQTAPFYTRA
jgi:hypothetical protein